MEGARTGPSGQYGDEGGRRQRPFPALPSPRHLHIAPADVEMPPPPSLAPIKRRNPARGQARRGPLAPGLGPILSMGRRGGLTRARPGPRPHKRSPPAEPPGVPAPTARALTASPRRDKEPQPQRHPPRRRDHPSSRRNRTTLPPGTWTEAPPGRAARKAGSANASPRSRPPPKVEPQARQPPAQVESRLTPQAAAPRPCPRTSSPRRGSHHRRNHRPGDGRSPSRHYRRRYRPPGGLRACS